MKALYKWCWSLALLHIAHGTSHYESKLGHFIKVDMTSTVSQCFTVISFDGHYGLL